MKLVGDFVPTTRRQLFYLTLVISLLAMLYFGSELQVGGHYKPLQTVHEIGEIGEIHEIGEIVSTLPSTLNGLSKRKTSQRPRGGSSNQEHYSTFEKADSNQLPLPVMHATNKFPLADFGPQGNDTLVMIHIQKTGGSEFLSHLVNVTRNGVHLCKDVPRRQKFKLSLCPRDPLQPNGEQWLISERTIGWICGVHASYTEFQSCFSILSPKFTSTNRKFHYGIFLRHPILRYISEFLHVQRNATWLSKHVCRGQPVSLLEMPPCYSGYYDDKPWPNLTLSSFISCESNWANNRQTMMLANLEAVGCYDKKHHSKEDRERIILEMAKKNLKSFSFFGITEFLNESCSIFEKYFGVKFSSRPPVRNLSISLSGMMLPKVFNNATVFNAFLHANSMDVELYKFALNLFLERAKDVSIAVNKEQLELELDLLRVTPISHKRKFEKLF